MRSRHPRPEDFTRGPFVDLYSPVVNEDAAAERARLRLVAAARGGDRRALDDAISDFSAARLAAGQARQEAIARQGRQG